MLVVTLWYSRKLVFTPYVSIKIFCDIMSPFSFIRQAGNNTPLENQVKRKILELHIF